MPSPSDTRPTWIGQILGVGFPLALVALVAWPTFVYPNGIYFTGPVLLWFLACRFRRVWHFARIANERRRESICTFARQFDCRQVDTRVLRAVYEELFAMFSFAVRPQDRLKKDLWLYDDDIDEIGEDCAARSRRSLRCTDRNPLDGHVETVGNLVAFLNHQPRLAE